MQSCLGSYFSLDCILSGTVSHHLMMIINYSLMIKKTLPCLDFSAISGYMLFVINMWCHHIDHEFLVMILFLCSFSLAFIFFTPFPFFRLPLLHQGKTPSHLNSISARWCMWGWAAIKHTSNLLTVHAQTNDSNTTEHKNILSLQHFIHIIPLLIFTLSDNMK